MGVRAREGRGLEKGTKGKKVGWWVVVGGGGGERTRRTKVDIGEGGEKGER